MRHINFGTGGPGPSNKAHCWICGAERWAVDMVRKLVDGPEGAHVDRWVCPEVDRCNDQPNPQDKVGTRTKLADDPPTIMQRLE